MHKQEDYQVKFDEYYNMLNPEQKQAVDTIEGPVLVLAGPCTGKTQTIAVRIAKILKDTQVDPQNILCLTFTEAAVTAMRNRLLEIIGRTAFYVRIHTFHSFCNEIIQKNPEMFTDLGSDAVAITDVEKIEILSHIFSELEFDNPLKPFGNPELYLFEVSKVISQLKRENVSKSRLDEIVTLQEKFFQDTAEYFKELKAINYRKLTEDSFYNLLKQLQEANYKGYSFTSLVQKLIETELSW